MSTLSNEDIEKAKNLTVQAYIEVMGRVKNELTDSLGKIAHNLPDEVYFATASTLFGLVGADLCAISLYLSGTADSLLPDMSKQIIDRLDVMNKTVECMKENALSDFVNAFVKKAKETNG